MKKFVILNGSPHKIGRTMALLDEVSKAMKNEEIELKTYDLNTMQIRGCQGCYACKKTGKCVINDDMQKIYPDINTADGVIFVTPVYLWQMTAQLKLAIDRCYPYLKEDYSSYLAANKKVLFVVTYGGGNEAQYRDYFELTCKSLVFLGFGEYKILITGGLNASNEQSKKAEVLAEAKAAGIWLLS